MDEGGVFLICDSLFEAALALLAVTTRNFGVGRVLSDKCLGHPETASGNGRVLKKNINVFSTIKYLPDFYHVFSTSSLFKG
jgi:hypothetical protein